MVTYRNPIEAFNEAISVSELSKNESSPLWAGYYMYMHTKANVDYFKHIETRVYKAITYL